MTNIKNPPSFEPTYNSITYQVYTTELAVIESQATGMIVTNTVPGDLS